MFKHIVLDKLDQGLKLLKELIRLVKQEIEKMDDVAIAVEELKLQVTDMSTVIDSTEGLLETLSAKLDLYADDPAQIRALAEQLRLKKEELAQAVVDNTPAA